MVSGAAPDQMGVAELEQVKAGCLGSPGAGNRARAEPAGRPATRVQQPPPPTRLASRVPGLLPSLPRKAAVLIQVYGQEALSEQLNEPQTPTIQRNFKEFFVQLHPIFPDRETEASPAQTVLFVSVCFLYVLLPMA